MKSYKYLFFGLLLVIAFLAWYFWDKVKEAIEAKTAQPAAVASGSGAAPIAETILQPTTLVNKPKTYQYGNAVMTFDDLQPTVAFTGTKTVKSAFVKL